MAKKGEIDQPPVWYQYLLSVNDHPEFADYMPRYGDMVLCWIGEAIPSDRPFPAIVTTLGFERRICVNLAGKDMSVLRAGDDCWAWNDPKGFGRMAGSFRWCPTERDVELVLLKVRLNESSSLVHKMKLYLEGNPAPPTGAGGT